MYINILSTKWQFCWSWRLGGLTLEEVGDFSKVVYNDYNKWIPLDEEILGEKWLQEGRKQMKDEDDKDDNEENVPNCERL